MSQGPRAPRVARDEARRRIGEAAERLLRDRPFRELTVDAVMTEAGLARTVFYRHYDGLPDLVLALMADVQSELAEFLGQSPEPGDMEFVDQALALAVDVYDRHGALLHAVDEAARYDPAVERAYRVFLEGFVEQTAALIAPNPHTPGDPVEVAWALTLMNGNYFIERLGRERRGDPAVVLATLSGIWRAAFRP